MNCHESSTGAAIAASARRWIGTPYRHQGSLRGAGCDCLGLVRGLWRELCGKEPAPLPSYGPSWGVVAQDEILRKALERHFVPLMPDDREQPGELLLFRMRHGRVAGHLGVLGRIGPEPSFIHAYSQHGVIESALSAPWRRRIVARFRFPLV